MACGARLFLLNLEREERLKALAHELGLTTALAGHGQRSRLQLLLQ